MTPADRLRSLVKEATPGPWRYVPDSDEYIVFVDSYELSHCAGHGETPANTRLMALAPQLAELVADMAEALTRYCDPPVGTRFHDPDEAFVVLARAAALFPEDSA